MPSWYEGELWDGSTLRKAYEIAIVQLYNLIVFLPDALQPINPGNTFVMIKWKKKLAGNH